MKDIYTEYKCRVCGYNGKFKDSKKYPLCWRCKTHSYDKGHNIKCEVCGRLLLEPHIHHIDGNPKNNTPQNRIAVCKNCHTTIHSGIDSKRKGGNSIKRNYKNENEILLKIKKYSLMLWNSKNGGKNDKDK